MCNHTRNSSAFSTPQNPDICPFCGDVDPVAVLLSPASGDFSAVHVIQCGACGAQGPCGDTVKVSREEWRRRFQPVTTESGRLVTYMGGPARIIAILSNGIRISFMCRGQSITRRVSRSALTFSRS
jgi:hypothetical protein